MAIVPRAQRQTSLRPIAGTKLTAADTPESLGAGLEQARAGSHDAAARFTQGLAQLTTGEAVQIANEERARANNTVLLKGDNDLAAWERVQLDQLPRGEAALGLPEKMQAEFEKKAGEIEARMNDEQRAKFAEMRARRAENFDTSIRRHTQVEIRNVEANEYKAGVDNNLNAIGANYDDGPRVAQELTTGLTRIRERAKTLGQGEQATKNEMTDFVTKAHTSVIKGYIANNRPDEARRYFDRVKGDIGEGDVKDELQTAVTKAGQRKTSQVKADEIITAGGSLSDQLDKAKGIDDADVRDMVEDRIRANVAVEDRKKREHIEEQTQLAFNIINKAATLGVKTSEGMLGLKGFGLLLDSLPPGEQSAVRSYINAAIRDQDTETDDRVKYDLWEEASKQGDAFATRNLWASHGSLSKSDFDELHKLQVAMRGKDQKAADAQLKGFRTKGELIDDTLTLYGIDVKNTKDAKVKNAIAVVRTMLDQRVEASGGLEKVTNEDMRGMLDDILTRSAEVPRALFGTTTKALIDLTVKDVAPHRVRIERVLNSAGRPVSDATVLSFDREVRMRLGDDLTGNAVNRIPKQDRADIEAALKAKGKTVTPDAVVDIYLEILARQGVR